MSGFVVKRISDGSYVMPDHLKDGYRIGYSKDLGQARLWCEHADAARCCNADEVVAAWDDELRMYHERLTRGVPAGKPWLVLVGLGTKHPQLADMHETLAKEGLYVVSDEDIRFAADGSGYSAEYLKVKLVKGKDAATEWIHQRYGGKKPTHPLDDKKLPPAREFDTHEEAEQFIKETGAKVVGDRKTTPLERAILSAFADTTAEQLEELVVKYEGTPIEEAALCELKRKKNPRLADDTRRGR